MLPASQLSPRAARAHALKNCLTVVDAVNQLVERELSDQARERLQRSRGAVLRMLALITEDLVAEGSTPRPKRELVLAKDVAKVVVERVEDRAEAAGVALCVQCGPGGVIGDAGALSEALGNLVVNAIEATPAGGVVFLETHECEDGSQVWTVQDTGPGIAPGMIEHLGRPFVSGRKGGSGIGIAFAREVIERHSGLVRFESLPDAGTRVSVWLPH